MRKIVFVFLCLLLYPSQTWCDVPSIINAEGTISNGKTIIISGSNFGDKYSPSVDGDYFDSIASEATYCGLNLSIAGEGNLKTEGSATDVDNCSAGGNFHQLEHLGWFVAVKKNAACYSTGFGLRKATGAPEPGRTVSSGDNGAAKFDISPSQTDLWISFMVRSNASGHDSNVDYRENPKSGRHTFGKLFLFRTPDRPQLIFLGRNNVLWGSGSCCSGEGYKITFTRGETYAGDPKTRGYPKYNTPCYGSATCSDYKASVNGKWDHIKIHIALDNPYNADNGTYDVWRDGVQIVGSTSMNLIKASGDEINSVKWFGNHSGSQPCDPDSSENITMDVDDLIVSTTEPNAPACVYLSNTSTWGSGVTDRWNGDANFVRQKVGGSSFADYGFKSWSNTQFKFEVNLSSINIYEPVYLYITNWNGETNSKGFHLVAGLPPAKMKGYKIDKIQ